jgi:hypothetical protein
MICQDRRRPRRCRRSLFQKYTSPAVPVCSRRSRYVADQAARVRRLPLPSCVGLICKQGVVGFESHRLHPFDQDLHDRASGVASTWRGDTRHRPCGGLVAGADPFAFGPPQHVTLKGIVGTFGLRALARAS